jgi:hypothetical protein
MSDSHLRLIAGRSIAGSKALSNRLTGRRLPVQNHRLSGTSAPPGHLTGGGALSVCNEEDQDAIPDLCNFLSPWSAPNMDRKRSDHFETRKTRSKSAPTSFVCSRIEIGRRVAEREAETLDALARW